MAKLLKALATLSAVLAMGAAPAFASPIKLMFKGTVNGGNALGSVTVGQSLNGSLEYDPATFVYQRGDGFGFASWGQTYYSPTFYPGAAFVRQENPPQVRGQVGTGQEKVVVGNGGLYDSGIIDIYRNYGAVGQNWIILNIVSLDDADNYRMISLNLNDQLGELTKIFADPNGGLDPAQVFNWLAPGSNHFWSVNEYRGGVLVANYGGELTSMHEVRVPEPATLALVGVALAGLAAMRRRRAMLMS